MTSQTLKGRDIACKTTLKPTLSHKTYHISRRKQALLKHLHSSRQRLQRLDVLAQWCHKAKAVAYCANVLSVSSSHTAALKSAADDLAFNCHGLITDIAAPRFDVSTAMHIFGSGIYTPLPLIIREPLNLPLVTITKYNNSSSSSSSEAVYSKVDYIARSKLLFKPLPLGLKIVSIHQGRLTVQGICAACVGQDRSSSSSNDVAQYEALLSIAPGPRDEVTTAKYQLPNVNGTVVGSKEEGDQEAEQPTGADVVIKREDMDVDKKEEEEEGKQEDDDTEEEKKKKKTTEQTVEERALDSNNWRWRLISFKLLPSLSTENDKAAIHNQHQVPQNIQAWLQKNIEERMWVAGDAEQLIRLGLGHLVTLHQPKTRRHRGGGGGRGPSVVGRAQKSTAAAPSASTDTGGGAQGMSSGGSKGEGTTTTDGPATTSKQEGGEKGKEKEGEKLPVWASDPLTLMHLLLQNAAARVAIFDILLPAAREFSEEVVAPTGGGIGGGGMVVKRKKNAWTGKLQLVRPLGDNKDRVGLRFSYWSHLKTAWMTAEDVAALQQKRDQVSTGDDKDVNKAKPNPTATTTTTSAPPPPPGFEVVIGDQGMLELSTEVAPLQPTITSASSSSQFLINQPESVNEILNAGWLIHSHLLLNAKLQLQGIHASILNPISSSRRNNNDSIVGNLPLGYTVHIRADDEAALIWLKTFSRRARGTTSEEISSLLVSSILSPKLDFISSDGRLLFTVHIDLPSCRYIIMSNNAATTLVPSGEVLAAQTSLDKAQEDAKILPLPSVSEGNGNVLLYTRGMYVAHLIATVLSKLVWRCRAEEIVAQLASEVMSAVAGREGGKREGLTQSNIPPSMLEAFLFSNGRGTNHHHRWRGGDHHQEDKEEVLLYRKDQMAYRVLKLPIKFAVAQDMCHYAVEKARKGTDNGHGTVVKYGYYSYHLLIQCIISNNGRIDDVIDVQLVVCETLLPPHELIINIAAMIPLPSHVFGTELQDQQQQQKQGQPQKASKIRAKRKRPAADNAGDGGDNKEETQQTASLAASSLLKVEELVQWCEQRAAWEQLRHQLGLIYGDESLAEEQWREDGPALTLPLVGHTQQQTMPYLQQNSTLRSLYLPGGKFSLTIPSTSQVFEFDLYRGESALSAVTKAQLHTAFTSVALHLKTLDQDTTCDSKVAIIEQEESSSSMVVVFGDRRVQQVPPVHLNVSWTAGFGQGDITSPNTITNNNGGASGKVDLMRMNVTIAAAREGGGDIPAAVVLPTGYISNVENAINTLLQTGDVQPIKRICFSIGLAADLMKFIGESAVHMQWKDPLCLAIIKKQQQDGGEVKANGNLHSKNSSDGDVGMILKFNKVNGDGASTLVILQVVVVSGVAPMPIWLEDAWKKVESWPQYQVCMDGGAVVPMEMQGSGKKECQLLVECKDIVDVVRQLARLLVVTS